jgi:hypothetical protein
MRVFPDWRFDTFWVVRVAAWLIAAIGVVYLVVAVQLLLEGKMGLGIAFLGYAFSNVGLYLAAR